MTETGIITTPPEWSTAVPDWAERIMAGRSLVPDLPLNEDTAEKALRVFKRLKMPDAFGNPTYGEACDDWVFDLVRVIFGSYDPDTKRRMISEYFLLIPKKNGKSSISSAIILTAAIVNERPLAELMLLAPTQKIADIAFNQIVGIIQLDAALSDLFHVRGHVNLVTHRMSGAMIVVKSADPKIVTGSKSAFTLIDELHELSLKPKAAQIMIEVEGGLAARPDGFLLMISTQSKKPPVGVFKAKLDKARAVRDGELRLPMLPVLYELPVDVVENGGWKDRKNWPLVNPGLGKAVDERYLSEKLTEAEMAGPDALQLFASQHFNVEIGVGMRFDRWIGADFWEGQGQPMTLAGLLVESEVAVIGIDGGGMDDLLGMAVLGRRKSSREWLLWNRAWAHPKVLERRKELTPIAADLVAAGDLEVCQHKTQDVEEIAAFCLQVQRSGLLPEERGIGIDNSGPHATIASAIVEAGIPFETLVGLQQGYKLNGAIKDVERKLFDGSLVHAGQPLMAWCVGNAKTEAKGNAVIVTKAVSGSGKIDPLMATFNAAMLMAWNPAAATAKHVSIPADYEVA